MGTLYYVGCYDCEVYRDLDKFYTMLELVENRGDALKFGEQIKKDSFRAGLLVSFMWKHRGHNCTVFSEHMEHAFPGYADDIYGEHEESGTFWHVPKD